MNDPTGRPRRRWDDRLALDVLVPLLVAYFALSVLYAWQAWRRETPTIFTDELETTQISRAIAATGPKVSSQLIRISGDTSVRIDGR